MNFSVIRNSVQRVMTQGDVGYPPFSSPFEWVLYACSRVYQLVVRSRIYLYKKRVLKQKNLPCKVVSVGNITVGGTGKTPMVHYVANLLASHGIDVAVVSRGYGGSCQRLGGIVSDGKTTLMGVRASGDEPQLLASKLNGVPLCVGKDRYQTGLLAIGRFGSSVLVLDDAFQHLALKRDLDLLLLDSTRPFGNGYCIPRGTLREPVEEIRRAGALVLTRWTADRNLDRLHPMIEVHARGRPVFRSMHVPDGLFVAGRKGSLNLTHLKGRRLFAFSGIAQNHSFFETVCRLEGHIAGSVEFPDHHRYAHDDLKLVWKRARGMNVDNVITTEKDYVNIPADIPSTPELLVLAISISFGDDTQAFEGYIKKWASSP
ncbi:MAG: tetraacyldisaccharide 4'-kinase [Desulfobacterales bacterium C00003060]|nr:MAG: tetraacyldisaccharide 4'-kinase [Desulfobacterales bacterium C00003060]